MALPRPPLFKAVGVGKCGCGHGHGYSYSSGAFVCIFPASPANVIPHRTMRVPLVQEQRLGSCSLRGAERERERLTGLGITGNYSARDKAWHGVRLQRTYCTLVCVSRVCSPPDWCVRASGDCSCQCEEEGDGTSYNCNAGLSNFPSVKSQFNSSPHETSSPPTPAARPESQPSSP